MIINNRDFYFNFISILFILLPFFLITGPFLTDLSVVIIVSYFLVVSIKTRDFKLFKNKLFLFFILFWIYIFLNSILNNLEGQKIFKSFAYVRFGIFVLAVIWLLDKEKKLVKFFFFSLASCFVFLFIDSIFQFYHGKNLIGNFTIMETRVSSFFGDELILGSYLTKLLPITLGLCLLLTNKKYKYFYFLFFIFFTIIVTLLSGERAAFFNLAIFIFYVILFLKGYRKKNLMILSIMIISIMYLLFNHFPKIKYRIFDLTFLQSNLIKKFNNSNNEENNNKYIFSKTHHGIFITALKIHKNNKIIGVGPKNFEEACLNSNIVNEKSFCTSHPHNTYLQFLVELGFIGFFLIVFVFIINLIFFIKYFFFINNNFSLDTFEILLIGSFLMTLWPVTSTGNFFSNWLSVIYYLPIAFFLWSRKEKSLF